jgi:hypothetical protein
MALPGRPARPSSRGGGGSGDGEGSQVHVGTILHAAAGTHAVLR